MIQIVYVCEYNLTFWLIKNFIINQWGEKKIIINIIISDLLFFSFLVHQSINVSRCVIKKRRVIISCCARRKKIFLNIHISARKKDEFNEIKYIKLHHVLFFFHWTFFKFNDLVGYFLRMWMWCDAYFFTDDDLYLKNCWWWSRCCCYNFLLPFFLWLK